MWDACRLVNEKYEKKNDKKEEKCSLSFFLEEGSNRAADGMQHVYL